MNIPFPTFISWKIGSKIAIVQIYAQKFYFMDTFLFYIAICAWNDDQVHYGVEV
jgi:hypothetical protein